MMPTMLRPTSGPDPEHESVRPATPSKRCRLHLTKILATLGPATDDEETLRKLIKAGATLFRLNFSHGEFEDHETRLNRVRKIAAETKTPVAVLADLPGPKLRTAHTSAAGIEVTAGQDIVIRPDLDMAIDGERPEIGCNYEPMPREVEVGQRVLINDGAIRMIVVEQADDHIVCRVTRGGLITSRKGINLPDSVLSVSSVTERDWDAAVWAVEHEIDFLALSFVRHSKDVQDLRLRLERICTDESCGTGLVEKYAEPAIPIIAKIETPQAVENIDAILTHCEGIMVARGDLGVEMELAQVPIIQKRLVARAHHFGKPCIVATQMLESMIEKGTPTRAEVSDVANAILDGADAVMLSGETAVGKFPVQAVEAMRLVAQQTEEAMREDPSDPNPPAYLRDQREKIPALAHGAWHMARDVGAVLVIIWSQRGGSARYLSRNGFGIPIIAFSSEPRSVRRMCLLHGVHPVLVKKAPTHRSDFAALADAYIISNEIVEPGQFIVLLGGKPLDRPGTTNTVSIRRVGEMSEV